MEVNGQLQVPADLHPRKETQVPIEEEDVWTQEEPIWTLCPPIPRWSSPYPSRSTHWAIPASPCWSTCLQTQINILNFVLMNTVVVWLPVNFSWGSGLKSLTGNNVQWLQFLRDFPQFLQANAGRDYLKVQTET
jgi:hypothetical protein